jgi:ketosteroid isomerase-like protein
MSQENVDLVAEGLREFQATLRATERAAADFVWDLSTLEGWPDATEYFGPEGFNEFVARWTEAYDEFEQRTEEEIDGGDQDVVSIISQRGRPRGSQSWVHLRIGVVWTVAEGEITRGRVFRTAEEALEAAGLRE